MPRKELVKTNLYPYHVITRTNNKDWFSIEMNVVWKYLNLALEHANKKCEIQLHSLVLMNNHYHLLLTTPNCNLDTFMMHFNKKLSDQIRVHSKRINRVFGGRYTWSLVDNQNYLWNVCRYIYQNPLRANLCSRVEDYKYSSLYYTVNPKSDSFPLKIFDILDDKQHDLLDFFNGVVSDVDTNYIRKGLRRTYFKPAKDPNTGKTRRLVS